MAVCSKCGGTNAYRRNGKWLCNECGDVIEAPAPAPVFIDAIVEEEVPVEVQEEEVVEVEETVDDLPSGGGFFSRFYKESIEEDVNVRDHIVEVKGDGDDEMESEEIIAFEP